jgi:Flp pilus assembly protein TadG
VRRAGDERGSALVEFTLIIPAFLLIVIGACTVVWLTGARSSITGAARDGARFASIAHDPMACTTPPCPTGYPTQAEVEAYVRQRAGKYGVDKVTLTRPTNRNEVVTVEVERVLPNVFSNVLGIGSKNYVTIAKARAE